MLIIQFCAEAMPFMVADCSSKGKAISIRGEEDTLVAQIFYDFSNEPLKLQGIVHIGDKVELFLYPHRIELYINGAMIDEEWPCGNLLFDSAGNMLISSFPVHVAQTKPKGSRLPSVICEFINAEGWKPEENVFVGDCMPYVNNNRYHVLYLKDRHHHMSKWGLGAHQWGHVSSEDFITWQLHPMAVEITHPWEGSICTGSWIKKDSTEYLFYTIRMSDRSAAPICRSISDDGYHFEKDEQFRFVLPDRYHKPSARDPKVIQDKAGLYHMILTTSLVKENKGCLAHLTSHDLDYWTDEGPIYVTADETQPECPDYFILNGWHYLVFSLQSKAFYLYSEKPFSDWRSPADSFIPCASVPKAAVWKGKVVFTGYQSGDRRCYAGAMTFASAVQQSNGELLFE